MDVSDGPLRREFVNATSVLETSTDECVGRNSALHVFFRARVACEGEL